LSHNKQMLDWIIWSLKVLILALALNSAVSIDSDVLAWFKENHLQSSYD
jgi:hypothetical protein